MKIKRKVSKDIKRLLISLLLGDGTISNNYVFKLCHSSDQKEYLMWKINQLNKLGIKNNGLKHYTSSFGYNSGKDVIYTQLSIQPIIKVLRKVAYKPKKTITKGLLKWLDEKGLAIWFMDDGCININTSKKRSSIQHTIKIATCVDLETVELIIEYFKEQWGINMRKFSEGNGFSIATSSEGDCKKFVAIVKPYLKEVPSLLYKIRNNFTKQEFIEMQARSAEHLEEMMI